MPEESTATPDTSPRTRRARGPTKPFPSVPFEKVAQFAISINQFGVSGEIQRLTLLGKLNMSSGSSATRALISAGKKYGLTIGNFGATSLKLTANGEIFTGAAATGADTSKLGFSFAIEKIDPFIAVYERLREKRLPDDGVLKDEFVRAGLSADDASTAAEIFLGNLRYLGLIQPISGSDHVRDISAIAPDVQSQEPISPSDNGGSATETPSTEAQTSKNGDMMIPAKEPSVHIDVQIHIDSNAAAAQIDQIFASMAKHLYGR